MNPLGEPAEIKLARDWLEAEFADQGQEHELNYETLLCLARRA